MKSKLMMPAFVAFTVVLFACDRVAGHDEDANSAASAADVAGARDAVRKAEGEMLAAFKAKDAARLASFYADEAVLASPGAAPASGGAAIRKALDAELADPAFALDFTNEKTDVAASADMAYTRGRYSVAWTNPQTKKVEKGAGAYLTVFRKGSDGAWKAVADYVTPGG